MNETLSKLKAGVHSPSVFNKSGSGGIARLFLAVMLMIVSLCATAQSPYETGFIPDLKIGIESANEFVTPNNAKKKITLTNANPSTVCNQLSTQMRFWIAVGSVAKFGIPDGYVVDKIEFNAQNVITNTSRTVYTGDINSTLNVTKGSNGQYTLTNPERKKQIEFGPSTQQGSNNVEFSSIKFTLKRIPEQWWRDKLNDVTVGRGSADVTLPSLPDYGDGNAFNWNGYSETVADQSVVTMTRKNQNTGERTITRGNKQNGSTTITLNYSANNRYDAFSASFNVKLLELLPVTSYNADTYTAVPMDESGKPISDALETEKVYWHITPKQGYALASSEVVATAYNQKPQGVLTINTGAGGVLEIRTVDDWYAFANFATTQNAILCADLTVTDIGTRTSDKPYSGIFDGQNHTLTLNYSYDDRKTTDVAPFRYINGATIINLNIAGSIYTTANTSDAASIVGEAYGKNVIEHCYSTVAITFESFNLGRRKYADATNAGMVGRINDNGEVTFNNCAFVGSFSTNNGSCFGGFVGWLHDNNTRATFNNCLMAAYVKVYRDNGDINAAFVRKSSGNNNVTYNNSYFRSYGNITDANQGVQINDEQLTNGYVAKALQADQATLIWGQKVGEGRPQFTSDENLRVFEKLYKIGNTELTRYYVNKGQNFPVYKIDTPSYITNSLNDTEAPANGNVTIDFAQYLKLNLPKDEHSTVTAKLGDKEIVDGSSIDTNDALVFNVTANEGYKLMTPATATMKEANNLTFANFTKPVFLRSENGYALISSKADWDTLAIYATSGNYRLTTDIIAEPVTLGVGNDNTPFTGIFDGDGHTLKVHYDSTGNVKGIAPFRYISGATIKNLHVTGDITTNRSTTDAAGIAGIAKGDSSSFVNCISSVKITFNYSGDATNGGLLGRISNTRVSFDDCVFIGRFDSNNGYSFGGFVGYTDDNGYVVIRNSYVSADFNVKTARDANTGNAPFARRRYADHVTIVNSYYRNTGNLQVGGQGTPFPQEDLASGKLAHDMQKSLTEMHWGQTLTGNSPDPRPVFTNDDSKRVYEVNYKYGDMTVATVYFNKGANPGNPPTGYELENPDYAKDGIQQDMVVKLVINGLDENGYYLISNEEDWKKIDSNPQIIKYRLVNDITVTSMVGSENAPFKSEFDGCGHTITVNYDYQGDNRFIAPFRFISGATIKNLRVAGNIITSRTTSDAAGIAGDAQGDSSSFVNCISSVNIIFNGNGDATNGGLLARAINTRVSFDDCAFIGSFKSDNGDAFGGFVGYTDDTGGYVVIRNSYVSADFNVRTSRDATIGNAPFARRRYADRVTIENCYYLNSATLQVLDQGTAFTREELANGKVAYGLQKPFKEMHWGQTLTGNSPDPRPVITDNDEKRVYEVSYKYGDKIVAAVYLNKGGNPGTPYPTGYELENPDYAKDGIQQDMVVELVIKGLDKDGYCLINNEEDWKKIVSTSEITKYRLVNDITVTTMVGSEDAPFKSEFDGRGHTITVNYDLQNLPDNEQKFIGPFRYVDGANIHNLRIDGEIKTFVKKDNDGNPNGYGKTNDVGGFAGQSVGNTSTFSDCVSAVRNTFLADGDATNGGFVGRANASIVFNNCSFVGGFYAPDGENFGGFVGFIERNHTVTLNNCLTAADFQVHSTGNASGNQPFARNWGGGGLTLNNSYYRTFENIGSHYDGEINDGNIITDAQLANGSVAYLLQGNQNELHWGQTLGTDNQPVVTSNEAKRVIVNTYDDSDDKVYDNFITLDENKGNKANISSHANTTGNVKLVRTFVDAWNTLVVPFDLTTEEVEQAFGKDTKVAYFTNPNENTVSLNLDAAGEKDIKANTPVLIYPSAVPTEAVTFAHKTISFEETPTLTGDNGIAFIGSYASSYNVAEGEYIIGDSKLWKSSGNSYIKGLRAFFRAPEGRAGSNIFLVWGDDDDPTAINSATTDTASTLSGPVYNLRGQKVGDNLDDMPKGIYIVNGKKIKK